MPNFAIHGGGVPINPRADSSAATRSGIVTRPLARAVSSVRQVGVTPVLATSQPRPSAGLASPARLTTATQRPPVTTAAAPAAAPAARSATMPTDARPVAVFSGPMLGVEIELHGVRVSSAGVDNKVTLAQTAAHDAHGNPLLKLVVDGAHRDKPCVEIVTAPHAPQAFQSGPLRDALDLLQKQSKQLAQQSRNAKSRPQMEDLIKAFNATLKGEATRFRLAAGEANARIAAPGVNGKRCNDYQQTNVMVPYAALAQKDSGISELFFSTAAQRARFHASVDQANRLADTMLHSIGYEGDVPMVRAFLCQMIYQDSILNEKAEGSQFYKDAFPFFIKTTLHDALFSLLSQEDVAVLTRMVDQRDFQQQMKQAIQASCTNPHTRIDFISSALVLDPETLRFRAICEPQELQWSNLDMSEGHEVHHATVSAIASDGRRKDFFANADLEYGEWTRGHIVSPYIGSRLPAFLDGTGRPYVVAEARKVDCALNQNFTQALASPAFQRLMSYAE
ncbi:hypothetical protein [Chromobacterium amazonense]|uniref:Uncharacterized protein n=2 Tax=Chromobacterium amazonense TaxID=1382803 RepID=A0ABU8V1Q0_9NEIS|nr:hypothetical protein [Chromobacterium amazonense]MDQ4541460.1 hypothetical protein [Chromobacterium amazonense]